VAGLGATGAMELEGVGVTELEGTGVAGLGGVGTTELEGAGTGTVADEKAGGSEARGDPGLPVQYG
jgi:hypothetical protein